MNKSKGFIVVSLIFLVIFTLISPSQISHVSAAQISDEILNFEEIESDGKNLEYTYDQYGESYKIIEVFDEDFQGVTSKIYKKNEAGDYELVSEKKSILQNDEMIVETKVDEEVTTEVFEIDTQSIENNGEINLEESIFESSPSKTMAAAATTGWQYQMTTKSSDIIKKFTVGAISIVVSKYIPWATASVLTQIANLAFQLNLPNLYYSTKWYYKYNGLVPVSEKREAYVYQDSARTKLIKGPITTIRTP